MQGVVHGASLVLLACLLIVAAVGDARRYIIPNWLCAAVAALSLPFWLTAGVDLWPLLGWQLLLAAVTLAIFAGVFAIGAMGGGDVKLFAALALWFPPLQFLTLVTYVALAGGVLTLLLLKVHRLRKRAGNPEIPYGLAISGGALLVLAEPIVNQFRG